MESANSEISSLKRTIDSLRHGLIETDIELDTVQRLHRRYEHKASVEGDRLRSVSQGHGRPSSLHARSLDGLSAQQIHSNSHYNEDLHESAAFSVNEISPDYSSGISRVSGRGDLSDAVQSALDAAAQLRQRNAASRFELDRLSSSQSSSRMRAREDASVATHATPPRDKRGVMSTTPTSLNLSTGPNSRGIPGQSYSLSSMSPTVGSVAIRSSTNMQQQLPRPQSMSRALGTSSTFSITRESAGSYYGGSPVEAASGSQTYRRKVKATVRRNN